MRLTYNQIIKLLRDFTESHYILNAFGNGEVWEMVQSCLNTDINYPMMWVEDQTNTIQKGEEIFNFRIYFLNQVATLKEKESNTLNETNINEVKSDMRQCASDLISYFAQDTNYPELTIDRNVSLTSFVDDTNDKLTGWYIDLRFKQAYTSNACYLPMEGIAPPPSVSCEDGVITINSVDFSTVLSGGTENVIVKDTNGDIVGEKIGNEWIVPSASCTGGEFIYTATGQNVEYLTYDEGYFNTQGAYNNDFLTDWFTLANANEWGHFKRFTGDTGGYLDEATGVFYDVNGVVTTYALAFPNNNLRDYYTRRKWNTRRTGQMTYNLLPEFIATSTQGSETGWRLPTINEYFSISYNGDLFSDYIDKRLFNWSVFNMGSSTIPKDDSTRFLQFIQTQNYSFPQTRTTSVVGAYIKNF